MQWSVARWLRSFDGVFHGTFNALPFLLPVPAVATIHDLSFEVHPEGFSSAKRRLFQLQARHAARVARRITTPSEHAKHELIKCYGVRPAQVLVTPWGIERRFDPARANEAPALCERLGVQGLYVVAMGGAPRRGLDVAVGACRRVRASGVDITLVTVGPEKPPAEPGVVHAGAVDDREWAVLLAGATAFCYPTRYEGFGVPALESLASGTPIVCARVGSLPEVIGEAAEWCESPTIEAIAEGLRRLLADPGRAAAVRLKGLERAARSPSWEHAAEVTLRAYHEARSA